MRKIKYIICNVLLLTFTGCNHQPVTNQLAYIDSLIAKEQFDSASVILNNLTEVNMASEDQAHYCLLTTKLGFITSHPQPSDSLIDMAITYYGEVGNNLKLADAYYYKSVRAEKINKDYPQAIQYIKDAERLGKSTDDLRLQFKIAEIRKYILAGRAN